MSERHQDTRQRCVGGQDVPAGRSQRYKPLESYGIVGDLRTVALVGLDGAIDFMCMPDFHSPSVFAALLDADRGGYFQIAPVLPQARTYQLYLPDTNVLLTRFLSAEGVAELSDFMPVCVEQDEQSLVRQVRAVRGEVHFKVTLAPRFDYARAHHRVERTGEGVVFEPETPASPVLRLRASVPVQVRGGDAVADLTLRAGETASFVLERVVEGQPSAFAAPDAVQREFAHSIHYWHGWINNSAYQGRWREMVNRSALTLKLLHSARYGGMVAAPTFGIPECIRGGRNWDYRYTWIRDASFTLKTLLELGFADEAGNFLAWLERTSSPLDQGIPIHVMYGLDGSRDLGEVDLSHLDGYRGTKPVRIGNNAYDQLQLDIYGELLDALDIADQRHTPLHHDTWGMLVRVIHWLCDNWRQSDNGIWESRGGRHEFLHSRVMCWVALDRALRIAHRRSLPAPVADWVVVRNRIYDDIYENFWNPDLRSFVQYPGSDGLDGALLMLPLVHFVSPTDPRWLSTLRAIEDQLVSDSLVYRYREQGTLDSELGDEGTFSACTFWFVECLALAGEVDRARLVFDKMLGYSNHLGLYGEELSLCGEHLGNFPQAFSHLALISAAHTLDRLLDAAHQP